MKKYEKWEVSRARELSRTELYDRARVNRVPSDLSVICSLHAILFLPRGSRAFRETNRDKVARSHRFAFFRPFIRAIRAEAVSAFETGKHVTAMIRG